jgi:hypothetical protein
MPNFIDITGIKFGRLTAISPTARRDNGSVVWLCHCDCGNFYYGRQNHLQNCNTTSCGCRKQPHGGAKTKNKHPLYRTWCDMFSRCNNPKHKDYKNYGGRGIKVDPRWNSFSVFVFDVGRRPPGLVLDRKNNNGDYSPSNVRWVTYSVSNKNRRPLQRRTKAAILASQE